VLCDLQVHDFSMCDSLNDIPLHCNFLMCGSDGIPVHFFMLCIFKGIMPYWYGITYFYTYHLIFLNTVKLSYYRPGQAVRVAGG
jgi:hypothetical protein